MGMDKWAVATDENQMHADDAIQFLILAIRGIRGLTASFFWMRLWWAKFVAVRMAGSARVRATVGG